MEATTVHIDEGAKVRADITADEVVIGGDYSGKLVCRQRLEIRATGQVVGHVETFRLMLHEGGSIDGELKMLKQPAAAEAGLRSGRLRAARRGDPGRLAPRRPRISSGAPAEAGADSPNGQARRIGRRRGCRADRLTAIARSETAGTPAGLPAGVARCRWRQREALRAALGEAVGAVDGLAAGGPERHLRDLSAAGAGRLEHLPRRAIRVAAAAAGAVAAAAEE